MYEQGDSGCEKAVGHALSGEDTVGSGFDSPCCTDAHFSPRWTVTGEKIRACRNTDTG